MGLFMPLRRLLISLVIGVLATSTAATFAPKATEITLQVTAEELGLECLSLHGAHSPEAISKFILHIHVGSLLADSPPLPSDHASPSTVPQVHLSVLSSGGEIIRNMLLKDLYSMGTHDLLYPIKAESGKSNNVSHLTARVPQLSYNKEEWSTDERRPPLDLEHHTPHAPSSHAPILAGQHIPAGLATSGGVVNVYVDDTGDAPANATDCIGNTNGADRSLYTGICTLRSAYEYCFNVSREAYSECAVHLPDSGSTIITMDPQYGSITVLPDEYFVSFPALLTLHGNGCNITQRDSDSTDWMHLFFISGRGLFEVKNYYFHMYNVSISGFENNEESGGAIVSERSFGIVFRHVSFFNNRGSTGGAVAISGGEIGIELSNCLFQNNVANTKGGAMIIAFSVKNVTITDCTFINNTARSQFSSGGSLYLYTMADIMITRCLFENSLAYSGTLYLSSSPATLISNCTFHNNTADIGSGIVIDIDSDYVTVSNSVFTDNTGGTYGAAMYVYGVEHADITNCSFIRNVADTGSAIYFAFSDGMAVSMCTFTSNYARRFNGAITIYDGSYGFINDCHFTDNTAAEGGSLYLKGSQGTTVSRCTFENSFATEGGAIYADVAIDLLFSSCHFFSNTANSGGAVSIHTGQRIWFRDCTFDYNLAYADGGAVYAISVETLYIQGSNFTRNFCFDGGGALYLDYITDATYDTSYFGSNIADNGGAIFLFLNDAPNFETSSFVSNSAKFGGSVYFFYSDVAVMMNCKFELSQAENSGGAVYNYYSHYMQVALCSFSSSSATEGGAVAVFGCNDITISSCGFTNNSAIINGGAVYTVESENINLSINNFTFNVALVAGGAVYAEEIEQLYFHSVVFNGNTANQLGGSLYVSVVSRLTIDYSQFVGSTASLSGGAIQLSSCERAVIYDSFFDGNSVLDGSGSAVYVAGSNLDVSSNNVFAGNTAIGGGGTVFWEYYSGMDEPLVTLNNFIDNAATYGPVIATEGQAISIFSDDDIVLSDYETNTLTFSVKIQDYYNQSVRADNTTFVTISTDPVNCNDETVAYVAGILQLPVTEGVGDFTGVQVFCAPGHTILLTATSTLATTAGGVESSDSAYVYFRPCKVGEIYDNNICVKCEDSYTFTSGGNQCDTCPDHASYCEGSLIWLSRGYWRKSNVSSRLLSCPMGSDSCGGGPGAGNDLCNPGYEDALCAVCSSGYSYHSVINTCEKCGDSEINPAALVSPVLLGVLVIIMCYFGIKLLRKGGRDEDLGERILILLGLIASTDPSEDKSVRSERLSRFKVRFLARTKVYITLYQILLYAPFVLDLSFPQSYNTVMAAFNIIGVNFAEDSGVTCLWHMDYVDKLLVQTLLPFFIAAVVGIVYLAHISYQCSHPPSDELMSDQLMYLRSLYSQIFLTLTYLLLPSTVTSIFRMFPCQNVDPDSDSEGSDYYLRADYSIECSSDRYYFGISWAIAMLCIYAIGIPLWYWYLLYASKNDIKSRQDVASEEERGQLDRRLTPIRFLFASYKPEYWYWELVETFQRISFAGVLVIINPGSTIQVICGLVLALCFIKLYSGCEPYVDDIISSVKSLTQWQIYVVYFIALLIHTDKLDTSAYHVAIQVFLIMAIFANIVYECIIFTTNRLSTNRTSTEINELNKSVLSPMTDASRPSCAEMVPTDISEGGAGRTISQTEMTSSVKTTSV